MRRIAILGILAACALAFAAADGTATDPATLVVDRDGVECANADFTSIQAAVDAAQPGDLIRVCPDLYSEAVTVDKPLMLKGDPDAVEATDCFQPILGELPTDRHAIVDPAGDGFSIAFNLDADDVVLEGFVVQGATVGIDASDLSSGYRIHHNLIRLNTLFGADFGSAGTRRSRADHNCIRENRYGLVSELDDDSLWKESDGPERDPWNARDLRNARIDHNAAFRNAVGGLEAAGPGERGQVTFEDNTVREGIVGIAIQNSTQSAVTANEFASLTFASIFLGGANDGLVVDSNIARGGGAGVAFSASDFIDHFPVPSVDVRVSRNDVAGGQAGVRAAVGNLTDSDIFENTTSGNRGNGILLFGGNTGNAISSNEADNNGLNGIFAQLGATGNRFEQNSMHDNALFDARDPNAPGSNVWIDNDCERDFPAGTICGIA
jgi:Right handed beta helix region